MKTANILGFVLMVIIFSRSLGQLLFAYTTSEYLISILHVLSLILLCYVAFLFLLSFNYFGHELAHVNYLLAYGLYFLCLYAVNGINEIGDVLTYIYPLVLVSATWWLVKYVKLNIFIYFVLLVFVFQVLYLMIGNGFLSIINRESRGQLGSVFGHANSFALVLACYSLVLWKKSKGFIKKNFLGTYFLMLLVGARSMIIGSAISIWVSFFMKRQHSITKVLAYLLIFFALTYQIVLYGISLVDESWGEQSISSGNSLKWRIIHWGYYLADLRTLTDWLFGFGVGSHENVTNFIYDKYFEVHNDFLRLIYDTGISGLVMYLIADYLVYKKISKIRKDDWVVVSFFCLKYFFMFFDNFVTNMMTVTGFYLLLVYYVWGMNEERHNNS